MSDEKNTIGDAELLNERLSAYFDGELSSEEKVEFEKHLARDQQLRIQLNSLKANWALLGDLPSEHASNQFTASTVEMVAIHATSQKLRHSFRLVGWIRQTPSWVWILAAALLAGAFAFTATRVITGLQPVSQFLEDRNTFLIRNLNFLEHFPEYQLADNIRFLTRLHGIDYFSSRTRVAAETGIFKHGQDSEDETRRRILGMNTGQKSRLHQNYVIFLQLPENEQNLLLRFHDDLLNEINTDDLSKLLITYARWYQQLDPLEQVEITLRAQDEKVAYIEKLIASANRSDKVVKSRDFRVMNRWLEELVLRNEKQILSEINDTARSEILELNREKQTHQLIMQLRKRLKNDLTLIMTAYERAEYQAMKSRLSQSCYQRLVRQPSIKDEINFVIELTRNYDRDHRSGNIPPGKRRKTQ